MEIVDIDNQENISNWPRMMATDSDDEYETPMKRAKTTDQLTREQEQHLVEWFEASPIFYDQTLRDFKNKKKRDRILKNKAKQMGLTDNLLWTWFKSMRTTYGKLRKRILRRVEKPLTIRQRWVVSSFQFLESHMAFRGENKQLAQLIPGSHFDNNIDKSQEDRFVEDSDSDETSMGSTQQSSANVMQNVNRRVEDNTMPSRSTIPEPPQTSTNNERIAFFHWVGLETQKFNEQLWNSYMADAFALVMRYKQA